MSPQPPTVLPAFSAASSHRVMGKRARSRRSGPRGPAADHQGPLPETLFREALVRERRRADRFEDVFVLVLISVDKRSDGSPRWPRVVAALEQVTAEADIVGWYEKDAVLGVIRSLDDRCPTESAVAAVALHQDLLRGLTPENAGACSIHLEVYSPHSDAIPTLLATSARERTRRDLIRDAAKRTLDVAGSATFLVGFSPVFLTVAALVKLTSKGPVFFRQDRVGRDGRPFPMLKFRTMHVNCDSAIHQQYVENFIKAGAKPAADGTVFKIVDDPRITRIGHFLRRSSLDEFPQFLNVLLGQMSLVGPRPPLPYEVAKYKGWHRRRVLDAKPGITGLWQVTGRSRTTFDEMVRLDLRYARTYSVWADLKILLATPRAVLTGKGAH